MCLELVTSVLYFITKVTFKTKALGTQSSMELMQMLSFYLDEHSIVYSLLLAEKH